MSAQGPFTPPPFDPSAQPWLTPAKISQEPFAAGMPASPAMYELRPLSTSEVLDRTFALYRSNFWLFAGLAAFSGAMQSIVACSQMMFQGTMMAQIQQAQQGHPVTSPFAGVIPVTIMFVGSILHFLTWSVIMAACMYALGEIYLGRPTSIQQSFRATIGRWYAYVGISLWQMGSFLWLPILAAVPGFVLLALAKRSVAFGVIGAILLFLGLTAGMVLGYIFFLRNSFGVPIAVLEQTKVRPAMRRSKLLTNGAKWRILLVWLITVALFMVVGVLQAPLSFISMMLITKGGHAIVTQALALIINFIGYTVVTPVPMIGVSLLYFDQRVRKEAFDIAFLLGEERALQTSPPSAEPLVSQQASDASGY